VEVPLFIDDLISILKTSILTWKYSFVDDTDTIQSEQDTQDPTTVSQRMQSGMDTWEGGIRVMGGALEPRKSFWYLLSFFWDEGVWRYATVDETPADISVRNHSTANESS
jgi:hypothetical protein